MKYKLCYSNSPTDFDIIWTDHAVSTGLVQLLKPHQKINHFPGMDCLSRKNNLAKNLNKIQKRFPHEYSFYP